MRRVFFSLERAERASKAAHDANIVIRGAYILLYVHVNKSAYIRTGTQTTAVCSCTSAVRTIVRF